MAIGILCYLILQGICVCANLYSVKRQVDQLNEKEIRNQHDVIASQFYELYYNLEIVKKFVESDQHLYHKENVNLLSEEKQREAFLKTASLLDGLVVDAGIIEGVVCIADHDNGRGFYYNFPQEELRVESVPTREELEAAGLEELLNQELFSISRRGVKCSAGAKESVAGFCDLISDEYIYYDILEESPVIILLDQDYISESVGRFGACGIEVYEHTNLLRFSLDAACDGVADRSYHSTADFFGDLTIRTWIPKSGFLIDGEQQKEAYKNLSMVFLLCSAVVLLLLFGVANLLEKNLKVICQIMKKQTDASEFLCIPRKNKRFTFSFSTCIFGGFFIPCMIGVAAWFAYFNSTSNEILNAGLQKYAQNTVQDISMVFDRTFQRYSTFMERKDVEYKVRSGKYSPEQLDIAYQRDVLSSTNYLPGYFYSVLVDENQKNLSQTMFSPNPLLDESTLKALCQKADKYGKSPCFLIDSDPIALQPKIVYLKKIEEQGRVYGYCFFFMDFPKLRGLWANDLLPLDLYLKEGRSSVNYVSLETLDEIEADMRYAKELYTVSGADIENSTFRLTAYGEKEDYLKSIKQIRSYMLVFIVMLMIIFAFIADCLKNVLVDSFNDLIRNMEKVPQNGYPQISKTTSINEFNTIAAAYNRMVSRLEAVLKDNVSKAVENNELELLQVKMEIQMLQHQINPHFLFNTLECINQMVICHKDDTVTDMIQDLSSILRYVLRQSNLVQVSAEIKALKSYVNIQRFRMEERNLQFLFDLDETLFECTMIKFILQPLVENSISHGVKDRENGVIKVTLHDWENGIEFTVSDNGNGMTREELQGLWDRLNGENEGESLSVSGIGLANVYRRIRLYYKEESDFVIESQKGAGTRITIRLPFVL